MTISTGCKKMMAFVMAVALVLSVLFIPKPNVAKADTVQPKVKVLGATLRLSDKKENGEFVDNNGKQSLRIGIQIDNANRARACAIQLTVGETSITMATEQSKCVGTNITASTKMHSIDTANNSVVYAVVLKNISSTNFNRNISIVGKVWDLDDNLVSTTIPTNKNVMGIINSIQKSYSGLNIIMDNNGTLYARNGAKVLEASDLSGYNQDDPVPNEETNVDISVHDLSENMGQYISTDDSGNLKISGNNGDSPNNGIISFNLGFTANAGDIIEVHVTGEVLSGSAGFRCYPTNNGWTAMSNVNDDQAGRIICTTPGEYDITKQLLITANGNDTTANRLTFKGPSSSAAINDVIISSVQITKVGNVAPTAAPAPVYGWDDNEINYNLQLSNSNVSVENAKGTLNRDGSFSIAANGSSNPEVWFNLPDGVDSPMDQVTITYKNPENAGAFGVACQYDDSTRDENVISNAVLSDSGTSYTYDVADVYNSDLTGIKLFINGNSVSDRSVTITSVVFHKDQDIPAATQKPSTNKYAVQVANNSITIDGDAESAWNNAVEYPFIYFQDGKVRQRNSSTATIKLLWDETHLYGMYDVYDIYIDSSNSDEWNWDGIEFFFDEDNSKEQ